MSVLSQKDLKRLLSYDPLTGVFTWLHRPDDGTRVTRWHNTRYARKRAGSIDGNGYRGIVIFGVQHYEHRLAVVYMTGAFPDDEVDHADGDRASNIWSNLRLATHAQNQKNQKTPINNTTGHKGVYKNRRKWASEIWCDGAKIRLGVFATVEEAAAARTVAETKYFGEFRRELQA